MMLVACLAAARCGRLTSKVLYLVMHSMMNGYLPNRHIRENKNRKSVKFLNLCFVDAIS